MRAQARIDEAIGALNAALEIDDTLGNAHEMLAASYLESSDTARAEGHLRRVIALDKSAYLNYLTLAQVFLAQRRYQEAAQVAQQGLAANPEFGELHFFLGNLRFEMGQFDLAAEAYRDASRLMSDPLQVLYNLGLALLQVNALESARDAFMRAIELAPAWLEAHINLGCVYSQMDKPTEATASFEKALALQPGLPLAHFNLGKIAMSQGDIVKALEHLRKALENDPNLADGHLRLGICLTALGSREEAISHFQRSLDIEPDSVEALVQLANLRLEAGNLEQALSHYREALALVPRHIGALRGLATALQGLADRVDAWAQATMLEEAAAALRTVMDGQPNEVLAGVTLGTILGRLGRIDEAESLFRAILSTDPQSIQAHHNLGVTMELRARQAAPPENMSYFTEALDHYSLVAAMEPRNIDALMGMASIHATLLQCENAAARYERILQIDPDYAPGRMSFGILKLKMGEFASGWRDWEARWNLGWPRFNSDKPAWQGQADLRAKTILLYNEQGFGDAIQFIRYASMLAERGARVLVKTPPTLKQLFATCTGVHGVFDGDEIPEHDFHCSLMSLPGIFATTLATIPAAVPYLRAAPERIEHWRRKFDGVNKLRVGLVWSGDQRLDDDRMRSLHFDRLLPLLSVPNVAFYSLQLGEESARQMERAPQVTAHVVNFAAELSDFQETAALAENLDLTICVDTSSAHLVGAIGKPVWLLNRFNTCWRWMLDRSDSPWYPTMRIFRQPRLGDWDSVIAEVRIALEAEAAHKATQAAQAAQMA